MSDLLSKKKSDQKIEKYFLGIGVIFFITIAILWLLQNPSREEAIGATGKIWDLLKGGITGWSPNYLLGGNSIIQQVAAWAVFFEGISLSILGALIGSLAALKIVALGYTLASGCCMYLFVKRLTDDCLIPLLASLAYVMMPAINVAIGIYEHFTVGLCFVFVPLILRGILVVAEERSPREILGLSMAAAALALSYTKIAVTLSPLLFLWTLEVLRLHPNHRGKIIIDYAISAFIAGLLAILILLPGLREFHFVAGFLFDPLEGWQHHYSFKSALMLIDPWGFLIKGAGPNIEGDREMFVVGFIPLLAISLGVGLSKLHQWRQTQTGRWFLILVACWLVSLVFAAGPDGLLLGHMNLLKGAQGMANASIPLLWLALFWLAWLFCQTIHSLIGGEFWRSLLIAILLITLPLFRLIQVLPLFNDIRAPESFWSVGGFSVLAAAVGIVFIALFREVIIPLRYKRLLAFLIAILFLAEMYPIYSAYWTRGLSSELFEAYDQVALFLKQAPLAGRVYPISSRYFYLTLPQKAGRAVTTESLLRHFQMTWVRHLEHASFINMETLKEYLNVTGTSYILIDKEDPMTSKDFQNTYRSLYPVAFENQYFVVLENQASLYPAFLAYNFVELPMNSYAMAPVALQLAAMNYLTVEMPQIDSTLFGFAGVGKEPNQVEFLPSYQGHAGAPFERVDLVGQRMDNYQQMIFHLPADASGWLTVTEAFHPDWTATIDGHPVQVYRAEAALLSVNVPQGSRDVIFKFMPPLWYSLCIYGAILSWVLALGSLLFLSSRFASLRMKKWWNSAR